MTQLIENKQSGPFLINYFSLFFGHPQSGKSLRGVVPYAQILITPNHYLRGPCATISHGGKMECCRTRRQERVRYNQ
jgi:hypothetical protein